MLNLRWLNIFFTLTLLSPIIIYALPPEFKIYFTRPPAATNPITNPTVPINTAMVEFINSTQPGDTLYLTLYNLTLSEIKTAILNAVKRLGSDKVYLIYEKINEQNFNDITGTDKIVQFRNDVSTETSRLMHNKFIVIKNRKVWTGSYNPTYSGTYQDNNNAVVVTSPELAQIYESEFFNMYNTGTFGETKKIKTIQPVWNTGTTVLVNSIPVQVYFMPYDYPQPLLNLIKNQVNTCRESIYFSLYIFGVSTGLESELNLLNLRGIDIAGVLEQEQTSSAYDTLKNMGLDVVPDTNIEGLLHHKFAVIDHSLSTAKIITGSANWTTTADKYNDENILIIHSPEIAQLYYTEFLDNFGNSRLRKYQGIRKPENALLVYPSPVKESATFGLNLPSDSQWISLEIYSVKGERVRKIVPQNAIPGFYTETVWDVNDEKYTRVAPGLYFTRAILKSATQQTVLQTKFAVLPP